MNASGPKCPCLQKPGNKEKEAECDMLRSSGAYGKLECASHLKRVLTPQVEIT